MLSVEIISHCLAYHHRELYRTENKPSHKGDCALFLRLYIAGQTRDGDLDNFFKHENHAYPPSLSVNGKRRFGTKSDLFERLERLCKTCGEIPLVDTIILDAAAVINMLKTIGVKKFQ